MARGGARRYAAVCILALSAAGPAGSQAADPLADPLDVFGAPVQGLDFEALSEFRLGRAVFRRDFAPAGQGDAAFDGLGPLFNAASCESCHDRDGRGRPPVPGAAPGGAVSTTLRLGRPGPDGRTLPDPVYGRQLQDVAVEGVLPEGRIGVDFREVPFVFPDGERVLLREPAYRVDEPAYGPLHPATRLSARIASPLFGLGLLAAIPEAEIAANADPDDADGDGVSGRMSRVESPRLGAEALGRFGWKGAVAAVEDQVASALAVDMGLSSPLAGEPFGDCTPTQRSCRLGRSGASEAFEGLEVHSAPFRWLARYASSLAVPPPRAEAGDPGLRALFAATGCAACHVPEYDVPDGSAGSTGGGHISPHTDLLLHDMGEGLDDGLPEGAAASAEWRTPPLWGVGLSSATNGNEGLLHDGRARGVVEAILWHGGEAAAARGRFVGLSADDRARLVAYVNAL